jgi:hypothetical protein
MVSFFLPLDLSSYIFIGISFMSLKPSSSLPTQPSEVSAPSLKSSSNPAMSFQCPSQVQHLVAALQCKHLRYLFLAILLQSKLPPSQMLHHPEFQLNDCRIKHCWVQNQAVLWPRSLCHPSAPNLLGNLLLLDNCFNLSFSNSLQICSRAFFKLSFSFFHINISCFHCSASNCSLSFGHFLTLKSPMAFSFYLISLFLF